jgi:hypothetical protein
VTILLYSSVIFLQVLTIYLDNKTNMFDFFNRIRQGSIATAYTNRGITLTVARTVFYAVPPLLGFLIINTPQNEFEVLIIYVSIINFLVTFCQCFFYCERFDKRLINEILTKRIIYKTYDFYVGVLAFMFFLMTPYLLNYGALTFPDEGLWIVQLNAVVNSFLTLYVIWIFEPRVAKKIDQKKNYDDEFFEAMFVRLCGRFLILLVVIFLLAQF